MRLCYSWEVVLGSLPRGCFCSKPRAPPSPPREPGASPAPVLSALPWYPRSPCFLILLCCKCAAEGHPSPRRPSRDLGADLGLLSMALPPRPVRCVFVLPWIKKCPLVSLSTLPSPPPPPHLKTPRLPPAPLPAVRGRRRRTPRRGAWAAQPRMQHAGAAFLLRLLRRSELCRLLLVVVVHVPKAHVSECPLKMLPALQGPLRTAPFGWGFVLATLRRQLSFYTCCLPSRTVCSKESRVKCQSWSRQSLVG